MPYLWAFKLLSLMKHMFLTLLAGLGLASCAEINSDPAPARFTRTVQTASVTYNLTSPGSAADTVLQNPKLEVFTYPVTNNADGSTTTSNTTGTLLATVTSFTPAQPIVLTSVPITVTDGVASPLGVRLVLTSTNRPGRRTSAQRLSASVVVNGVSRVTSTLQGTSFARNVNPPNGLFTATVSTNVGGYTF